MNGMVYQNQLWMWIHLTYIYHIAGLIDRLQINCTFQ